MLCSKNGLTFSVINSAISDYKDEKRYTIHASIPNTAWGVDGFVFKKNYRWKLDGVPGILLVEDARVVFKSPGPGREVYFTFINKPNLDFNTGIDRTKAEEYAGTMNLTRSTANQSGTRLSGDAEVIGTERGVEEIIVSGAPDRGDGERVPFDRPVEEELKPTKKPKNKIGEFFHQFANLILDGL